ncbi:hypothetical protein HZI73_09920 [Vallitalea pronyensis]|uniref:Uncharacterized protein n=1 Tax=Vallitalea pronyensis TaxID=1348613 RepID=A0A8J8MJU9_9FIRM|nr:hypothetical protein [Vallitalea pronyensis]QUI22598.1 hypothetical protein HZI73_09920 [Vallitalea pronyensis]
MCKKLVAIVLILCMAVGFNSTVLASTWDQEVSSETSTKPTKWDGTRYSSNSGWSTFYAPAGKVIFGFGEEEKPTGTVTHTIDLKNSADVKNLPNNSYFKVYITSMNGSENKYIVQLSDYVQIGWNYYPTKMKVQVHARSPKGSMFELPGRGWTEVKTCITYRAY